MLDPRIEVQRSIPMLGLLSLLLFVAGGCIADETVLEPATEAVEIPRDACEELIEEGVVDEVTTGEPCMRSRTCGTSETCFAVIVDCKDDEDLVINDVSVLECPSDPETEPVATDGEPFEDCEDALREGQTGQACAPSFTCGRVADECCAEIATCGLEHPDLSSDGVTEPSQRLIRLRLCTRDCQNLAVDDSEVATDCESAYTQTDPYVVALGRACSGDFVCVNGVDVRASGDARALEVTPEIAFCSGGVVLGRKGPLQPPALWPLL